MTYHAPNTGQITFNGATSTATSKVHEFRGGMPICGQPLDPRKKGAEPASYTSQGPGVVTCRRCARCGK